MVSPGTHLVKNHEWANESQFKRQVLLIEAARKTDTRLQITEIKIYSFCCTAQQRVRERWVVKQQQKEQPQKSHQTGFSTKTSSDITRSLRPRGHIPWIILCLWGFVCIRDAGHRMQDTGCRTQDAGRRGNKITVSVYSTCLYIIYQEVMGFQM